VFRAAEVVAEEVVALADAWSTARYAGTVARLAAGLPATAKDAPWDAAAQAARDAARTAALTAAGAVHPPTVEQVEAAAGGWDSYVTRAEAAAWTALTPALDAVTKSGAELFSRMIQPA
jgi:hypothetical protein